MRAILVDIYIDHKVVRVEHPLYRRKDEDVIEVAFRNIDICVFFAVNAEEICIFFELLPQIRTIAHQEVHLTRIIGF